MSDLTNWVRDICEQYGNRIVGGLLLFFALVVFGIAQAATINATCTPPTTNTNGSPITGALSYSFHWGTSASSLNSTLTSSTCNVSLTVPDPVPGTSVTYFIGAKAIVGGNESALSNVVSAAISTPVPTPNPPTGLRVIDTVAYRLNAGSHNKVSFAAIGTVPLDTACASTYSATVSGVTMHIVNRTAVTPVGSLPYQVWAKCSAS
jgi:hypothetical protein